MTTKRTPTTLRAELTRLGLIDHIYMGTYGDHALEAKVWPCPNVLTIQYDHAERYPAHAYNCQPENVGKLFVLCSGYVLYSWTECGLSRGYCVSINKEHNRLDLVSFA